MKKLKLILFLAISIQYQMNAQNEAVNNKIDALYETLRTSLKEMNIEKMASIYTDDSKFLAFNGKIGNGKAEWTPGIIDWFKEVAEKGDKIDTRFQVEKRYISEGLVVDVGYFYATRKGSKIEKNCGKMVNVFIKSKNNNGQDEWKFAVDMSSDAPLTEFIDIDGDTSITIKK
ncbi:hypothetical protein [Flavobacterium sp. 25HG05S-40]|uniref:hypothetical protein n=1 Tax=Flavobacterium sp. 25HG05S-40 TaxID=3458682 RepID=UPI0040448052